MEEHSEQAVKNITRGVMRGAIQRWLLQYSWSAQKEDCRHENGSLVESAVYMIQ